MLATLERLFRGKHRYDLRQLRQALIEVERDRRRIRFEIARWERQRHLNVERIKRARGKHNELEVDYLWDELKELRRSGQRLRRQGRTYNVEAIALKRYLQALEGLEKGRDGERSRQLFERIQHSGLLERLELDREAEIECLREVNRVLGEFGEVDPDEVEDPEKTVFLAELDGIRAEESDGDPDDSRQRQRELLDRFQEVEAHAGPVSPPVTEQWEN